MAWRAARSCSDRGWGWATVGLAVEWGPGDGEEVTLERRGAGKKPLRVISLTHPLGLGFTPGLAALLVYAPRLLQSIPGADEPVEFPGEAGRPASGPRALASLAALQSRTHQECPPPGQWDWSLAGHWDFLQGLH